MTALSIAKLASAPNIATLLDDETNKTIATQAVAGYKDDVASREDWVKRNGDAMRLALQVANKKTDPWEGCANVKFPLVTIAAMHYHARAYPLLVDGNDLVKCITYGPDPDGQKAARARRIAEHMTWQALEQQPEWEEEHDRLLLIKAILGTAYKRTAFDAVRGRQISVAVSPEHLVCNYYSKGDVNDYVRATYVMEMQPNDVRERVVRGVYIDYDTDDGANDADTDQDDPTNTNDDNALGIQREPVRNEMTVARDERTGVIPPQQETSSTAPITMLEQLCWLDLDDDDYAEPYIVTVELETQRLRRIVARYTRADVHIVDRKVAHISPERIYTKYGLIPSPDGSCLDIGFGHLLGPINESVNTAINQIFDGATMATLGGGFLGRGARMKGGDARFKPNEWKHIDTIGGDLAKNIVSLPVREPSAMLLQLVLFLVNYGERVASANEIQQGENVGQNTPAETARTMNQNGGRIFAAMFKRAWRSMRDEFRVKFDLNRTYLRSDVAFRDLTMASRGGAPMVSDADYEKARTTDVRPAADPTVISEQQLVEQATAVMQLSMTAPGFHRYNSMRRYLEARRVPNIDEIFPRPQAPVGPDGQPAPGPAPDLPAPPDPKMLKVQIDAQKLALDKLKIQNDLRTSMLTLQMQAQKIGAEILELRSRSVMELAQAKGVDQGHQIALIDAQIGAKKNHMDFVMGMVDAMAKTIGSVSDGGSGDGGSEAAGSDAGAAGGMAPAGDNAGVFSLPAGPAATPDGAMGGG